MQDFLKQKATAGSTTNIPSTTTTAPTTKDKPYVKPRITPTPTSRPTSTSTSTPKASATPKTTSVPTKSFLQPTANTSLPTLSTILPTTSKPKTPTTTNARNEPNTTERTQTTVKEYSTTDSNLVVILLIIVVVFCLIFFVTVFWIYKCYTTYPFEIGFSRCYRQRHPNYVRPPLVLWRTKTRSYGIDSWGKPTIWKRSSIHEFDPFQPDKFESSLKIDPEFLNADFIQMKTYSSEITNAISNVTTEESDSIANLPIIIENQVLCSNSV